MALHNFIRDSHWEDHDFVQWQRDDDGEGEEADSDSDEEEEEGGDDDDDRGGGHIVYEPTRDRAMEDCVITSQMNMVEVVYRIKCWFFFAYNFDYHLYVIFI
ncbi:hypothetical protein Bca52824_023838 [Brassica carinata]|uniref:Uncharacterized protein n=1 Tax=Brassica carinata TaxID=52824 RepID=A0A8X7VJ88_BRACI|nr:hypothetical protein Bca52824_023838 [Brassica carinata]